MIRAADAVDAAAMADLHARAFDQAWSEAAFADLLSGAGAIGLIEAGSEPNGFALARFASDEAEILTLAVSPQARRAGRGRRLLSALETACLNAGAARLFLEVSELNAAARALYEGAGFKASGRRAGYYADGSDALLLDKRLR